MSEPDSTLVELAALVESFPPSLNDSAAAGLPQSPVVTQPLSTEPPSPPASPPRLHSLDDLLDAILCLARARGRAAAPYVASVTQQLLHAQEYVSPYESGPTLAILDQPDRAAGGWIVQLAERAGAQCTLNPSRVPPGLGTSSGLAQAQRIAPQPRPVRPEALLAANPDFILLIGSPATPPHDPWKTLTSLPNWGELRATRAGRTAWLDRAPSPFGLTTFMWFLTGWLQGRAELIPSAVVWFRWQGGSWIAPG